MGFAPQLNEILRYLPTVRQTLFFSATLPKNILKLAAKYLKDPVRISVGTLSKPVETLNHTMVETTNNEKNNTLVDQLEKRQGSVLIFARTKHRTDRVARFLEECGYSATRIHGGRNQGQRNAAIQGFRGGRFRILVATDIAARGLDIPHIAHVINYDLPMATEDFVHRVGRTARAGAKGEAVSLVLPEDRQQWRLIQRIISGAPVGNASRPYQHGAARQSFQGATRGPRREESQGEGAAPSHPARSYKGNFGKKRPFRGNGGRPEGRAGGGSWGR